MFTNIICILLLFPICFGTVVKLSLGELVGKEMSTSTGKKAHFFKRIPFVEPPVNELRFAKPQPKKPWKDILDATEYGPACMTNMSLSSSVPKWVDEDCLHLNIFSSDFCLKRKSCPVVFFMHGGNLMMDSAVMFDDQTMLDNFPGNDVVLVVAAFRLGLFSTLTFESDKVVPRNLASYDMIAGLEFVRKEIHNFGGNADDVTIMGHSAGAEQVLQLAFSKVIDPNKRLFHKLIAMSPAIYFADVRRSLELSWEATYRANCSITNHPLNPEDILTHEAISCLRKINQYDLLRIQRELEVEKFYNNRILLLPPLFDADNILDFYEKPPIERPLLIGSVRFEITDDGPWQIQNSKYSNYKFHSYHNPIEVMKKYIKDFDQNLLAEKFKFNHSHISQTVFLGAHKVAQSMRKAGGNVYLYSYENPRHAEHTDDLYYLLGTHPFEKDENEQVLSKLYVKYFINFIKTGVPDSNWISLQGEKNNYMHIDVNVITGLKPYMNNHYNKEVLDYWLHDMVQFDNNITLSEKSSLISIKNEMIEDIENYSKSNSFYSLFKGLILFILGIIIGHLCTKWNSCSGYKRIYHSLPQEHKGYTTF